jgi:predicted metal-dependent hydrolase
LVDTFIKVVLDAKRHMIRVRPGGAQAASVTHQPRRPRSRNFISRHDDNLIRRMQMITPAMQQNLDAARNRIDQVEQLAKGLDKNDPVGAQRDSFVAAQEQQAQQQAQQRAALDQYK